MIYDLIIIGMGPAGISAAIYAKRGGLNVLALESKMPGGLINYTNIVDNYPGFKNISGPDLAFKMYEHLKSLEIDYKNENVEDIEIGNTFIVKTSANEYSAKKVIIATGRSRRALNLPGEQELRGHGISYCALCDGNFYKNKDVAVVGAGDSSLEEALYLSNIVNKVTIIVRSTLRGNQSLINKVKTRDNIEILIEKNVTEFLSENGNLTGIKLDDGTILSVSGLFIYIGFDPILPFKSDIGLKLEKGYIVTNEKFETNIEGLYAIGDIIKKDMYQIISAEYEGAIAASDIVKKLTA